MSSTDDIKLNFGPESSKGSNESESGSLDNLLGDSDSLFDFDFGSLSPSLGDKKEGETSDSSNNDIFSINSLDDKKTEEKSEDSSEKAEAPEKKSDETKSEAKKPDEKPEIKKFEFKSLHPKPADLIKPDKKEEAKPAEKDEKPETAEKKESTAETPEVKEAVSVAKEVVSVPKEAASVAKKEVVSVAKDDDNDGEIDIKTSEMEPLTSSLLKSVPRNGGGGTVIEFGSDSPSSPSISKPATRDLRPANADNFNVAKQRIVPSATIEFGDDEPDRSEPAPDMSNSPIVPKSEFERTIVFEKNENRWDDADHFVLPKPGDTVGGYKIVSELGRGGFGAVYKAKNLTLGREEALKLILPSAKNECEDIEKRFNREIDIVSRLEHPNIVRLYSSGVLDRGVIWMTMELVRGDRLDDRLAQYGAMRFEKARNIMCQLLCGLQEAHKHQIVHRDLKPANIILSKKEGYADQVVILDFGLSKAIGSGEDAEVQELTSVDSRRIYGTPQYMAPEQLNRGKLGPWTDVYSAGLILFELLCGKSAVDGDSLFDVAFKQAYEPLTIPELYKETAIETILNKACAKNPANRYKDAGEFFDALQRVEDETDPPSVLENEMRGGRNLSDIGMLHKSRSSESTAATQIGLSPIEQETVIRHTERTDGHRQLTGIPLVGIGFLVILALLFIILAVFSLIGLVDINLKF